jgi:uncharacterized protein (TIGR04255 family)
MDKALLKSFAARPRVIYSKNPLVQVIAAIRFPVLFPLMQEYPSEFQRSIGDKFPMSGIASPLGMILQVPEPSVSPLPGTRQFIFQSADQAWTINLDPQVFALTCSRYTRWEEFSRLFSESLDRFLEVFKPALITRFGLRYVDVIDKKKLGLENKGLSELLRPELLNSFLFFTEDVDKLNPFQFSTELGIDSGSVRIVVSTIIGPDKHEGVLIDTDCYVEPAEFRTAAEIVDRAERFHAYSSVVFRNCITELLHETLQPQPVDS